MKVDLDGVPLRLPLPRLAPAILAGIDGTRSLGDIHTALQAHEPDLDFSAFKAQFDRLYEALNELNHLLIRFHEPGSR